MRPKNCAWQSVLTVHGNAADDILAKMLLIKVMSYDVLQIGVVAPFFFWFGVATYRDLKDKLVAVVGGLKSVQNGRKTGAIELDCKKM